MLDLRNSRWRELFQPSGARRWVIAILALLVFGYAVAVLSYVRSIPEIGLRFGFRTKIHQPDPKSYRPDSGPVPADDDTIRIVGDKEVKNWGQLLQSLAAINGEPEDHDDWSDVSSKDAHNVRVSGQQWVWVQYEKPSPEGDLGSVWAKVEQVPFEALLPSILWLFLKGSLFVIGAWVLWKRPEDRSAMQFFLLCMVTCNAFMGGYHWQRIATQPVLLVIFMASAVLLPAFSLHFYLIFPRPKAVLEKRPKLALGVIYGVPAGFLLFLCCSYAIVRLMQTRVWDKDPEGLLETILYVSLTYLGVAACWYLACVVSLLHSYRTAADPIERNQVKCILLGAMAALVPIGYTLYLAFLNEDSFASGAATWPMFAASVCLNLAYAVSITRYRLMQLDQLISSGVVYFLFSFLAGLVYYLLVLVGVLLVGSQVIAVPSLTQAIWVSTTALVLMVVLDLVRGRLRKALDHRFRREKYQLDRTLRRMSQAIEQLVDPPTLVRRLLHVSTDLLGVSRGAVYLREDDPPRYCLTDSLGPAPSTAELSPSSPLIEALPLCGTLVGGARPPHGAEGAHRQLQLLGGELAQGVVHEGQLLALLILGPKELAAYSADDMNVVAAFAQMTALALASAEGHRTIETLNQELRGKLAKIAEQQRRIANLQSQLVSQSRVQGPKPAVLTQPRMEIDADGTKDTPDLTRADGPRTFVGSSPQVHSLLHHVDKVAASPSAVVLRGESGTGKEVLARILHDASPRAGKAFVKVHCAALSPTLLESELFGHVKGAFTGAHRDKVGRFESAHGGTLFLDEIGDISLEIQTKLLRVLQEKTIERVGSSQPVEVDVRLISATHQDLEKLIREGRFRDDLYYRLNVISIAVPPLRERNEDIPELAVHFLRIFRERSGKTQLQIDDDALLALKAYSWPGNIRQLENAMERAVVIAEGAAITLEDLPAEILHAVSSDGSAVDWKDDFENDFVSSTDVVVPDRFDRRKREQTERESLVRALALAKGNKAEAARALGMARSTLFSRLRKHGLS